MIFNKAFRDVSWPDIEQLIANDQPENENLDYKRDIPGRTDGDRKEFLADVSSFANSEGGFIIYGIEERLEGGQKTGRPSNVVNIATHGTEISRLEQIYTTGITPKIPDIEIRAITKPDGTETVVVIKIAKSFVGPHLVSLDQQNKFFIRRQNGKFPMDYLQIRDSFLQSNSIQDKIKMFCDQREQLLIAKNTPAPITGPQSLLLHIVPISTFGKSIATATQLKDDQFAMRPMYSSSIDQKINLDGLARFHAHGLQSYVQVFWDLTHEFADSFSVTPFAGRKEIFNATIGKAVCRSIKRAYANMQRLGVNGPKAILLRLNGMAGIPLSNGGDPYFNRDHPFDRNRVLIPDVVVDDNDHLKATALLMEKVANAAGFESSAFVTNGSWAGGDDER